MWDSNAVYFSLIKMKIMASQEIYLLKPQAAFRMAYSKTCTQPFGFFTDLIGDPSNVLHVEISACHMSVTSSFRYQRRRSVLSVFKMCAILFCIHVFFDLPLCLIMEKMNERSSYDVVTGSGKFIFVVSTGYLFGVCNLCASDFT